MEQRKSSTQDQSYKTIKSERSRDLLLRVCDGVAALAPVLWYIHQMKRCDEACLWLIKNNLTGKNLYAFWFLEKEKSFIEVMARINQGLEKEDKLRPLFVGRDL